jgi:NAD(P)H-dependent flavin oxidoreductase YrpB (nitropropane dioxygenase family)
MPGRAIINPFLRDVAAGQRRPFSCSYQCLKPCDPSNVPYCIAEALLNAQQGNLQEGFAFVGSNAHLCKEIIPVNEIFRRLDEEYRERKVSN